MGKHAFLSASSSHRWLECPPSAKLCSEQEDRARSLRSAGYRLPGTVRLSGREVPWKGCGGSDREPYLLRSGNAGLR